MHPNLRPLAAALMLLPLGGGIAQAQAPATQIRGERVVSADLVQVRAIVETVNQAERSAVLNMGEGRFRTVRAGPEVRNFAQVRPGDVVEIDLYEEVALVLARNAPEGSIVGRSVSVAPLGAKPGAKAVKVTTVTTRIEAIDATTRRVTLRRQNGTLLLVKAPDDVDLSKVSVGDDVVAVVTEAVAIEVRKP